MALWVFSRCVGRGFTVGILPKMAFLGLLRSFKGPLDASLMRVLLQKK